jgi:hypothetical protein
MQSGITSVTASNLNGLPIDPPKARKSFKYACGFQVRDNITIIIPDLQLVPKATKELLWKNIMEKIKYPDGVDEGLVKSATLISMGRLFCTWKLDMNG